MLALVSNWEGAILHFPLNQYTWEVRDKLVDVLTAVWSMHAPETKGFLERHKVPESLREQVRIHKTRQRVVADLLKGGLGPWGQFQVSAGFSDKGWPTMAWIFHTAATSESLDRFLSLVAQKAINILADKTLFPQVEGPGSADTPDPESQKR